MKSADLLLYLQRSNITVFTTGDVAKITGKPIAYARKVVSRIPGVRRAERGLYYTERASIYEIASNFVAFSYVSMLSALRYYDMTTQMPRAIDVVSPKAHRVVEVEGREVRFLKFKKSLLFGAVRRDNAIIASPEKALLDCLYYGSYAYLDEAFSIGFAEKLVDLDKLTLYALRFENKSLINKLGFFLESFSKTDAKALLKRASANPVHLASRSNKYNKRWRVYYGG